MKLLLGVVVLLTIFFYPKAYFIYKSKEGLVLDCQCYGMPKGNTGRAWGINPTTKKLCYGVPSKCITKKISWWNYVKSDWVLVSVILVEMILIIGYTIADKNLRKEGLSN